MKTKLIICDLDGTLFDTDEVNYYAYKEALAAYGVSLDKDWFNNDCKGRKYTEFLPQLLDNDQGKIASVHKMKKEAYAGNLNRARKNEFLFDYISFAKPSCKIAIVTTASRKNVEDILNHFKVRDLFDLILTQEDIVKSKPDPEGFIKAMTYFNITPDETVIYEDSLIGIQAAMASKAGVMAVKKF